MHFVLHVYIFVTGVTTINEKTATEVFTSLGKLFIKSNLTKHASEQGTVSRVLGIATGTPPGTPHMQTADHH